MINIEKVCYMSLSPLCKNQKINVLFGVNFNITINSGIHCRYIR